MKQGIHPDYQIATVRCSCGNTFQTRSTVSEIRAEICSNCHPFYTGKQKLVDAGGRVERFQRRYAQSEGAKANAAATAAATARQPVRRAERVVSVVEPVEDVGPAE
jgi:large subunit ribosomal protein L31